MVQDKNVCVQQFCALFAESCLIFYVKKMGLQRVLESIFDYLMICLETINLNLKSTIENATSCSLCLANRNKF